MRRLSSAARIAAALITTPLVTLPAWGAPCVTGSVASYIALGATGCSVDGLTFSNIQVNVTTSNNLLHSYQWEPPETAPSRAPPRGGSSLM